MEIDVNTVLCMQDLRTLIRYYFDINIYIWEHLEIKVGIKIIQYVYAYVISHSFLPKRIVPRLEDSRQ